MHSHSIKINVGMLYRRMYCCKCGTKLKRRSTSHLYKKGEVGYIESGSVGFHTTIVPLNCPQIQVRYVYICPNCKQITTYDQQCIIAKKQKQAQTKILDEKK